MMMAAPPSRLALRTPLSFHNSAPRSHISRSTCGGSRGQADGEDTSGCGVAAPAALACPLFYACSGCTLEQQLMSPPLLEDATAMFAEAGVALGIVTGPVHGWRCRAKLVVQGAPQKPSIGLYAAGSHTVVDIIPQCRTHHPLLNATAALVRQLVSALKVPPFNDKARAGRLRHVQLTLVAAQPGVCAEQSSNPHVQVVLVWAAPILDDPSVNLARRLGQALWAFGAAGGASVIGSNARKRLAAAAPSLHSVWLSLQPDSSKNAVLGGGPCHLLHGPDTAWQRFGAADVALAPASFVQANYGAMQRCLALLATLVPKFSTVAELYAGSGTIGLHLLRECQCHWVRCVEVNPACHSAFVKSAEQLPAALQGRIELQIAHAGDEPAHWVADANVLVADPPRKGLDGAVLDMLCNVDQHADCQGLRRLVYVSCGYTALKRDCARLVGSSRWQLVQGTAFIFFPGTNSLETVAVFDRC